MSLELGFDLFNVFNTVNFANPNSDLQDSVDFGTITKHDRRPESRSVQSEV